jgi:hypothetical protein
LIKGVSIKQQGLDALLDEEVVLYREIFRQGVVLPEIHKGKLFKEGEGYYIENGAGKINLQNGDRILFRGWERTFRKPVQ